MTTTNQIIGLSFAAVIGFVIVGGFISKASQPDTAAVSQVQCDRYSAALGADAGQVMDGCKN